MSNCLHSHQTVYWSKQSVGCRTVYTLTKLCIGVNNLLRFVHFHQTVYWCWPPFQSLMKSFQFDPDDDRGFLHRMIWGKKYTDGNNYEPEIMSSVIDENGRNKLHIKFPSKQFSSSLFIIDETHDKNSNIFTDHDGTIQNEQCNTIFTVEWSPDFSFILVKW